MRAMFGLVGLLVTLGVIAALWSVYHPADIVRIAEPAKRTAEQIAGVDSQGVRAKDSIKLQPFLKDNKLRYILVDDIVPGGPMEKYFGLKRNDSIIAAGPLDFKDQDAEMALELIQKAYQEKGRLTVIRSGKQIELPLPPGSEPAPNTKPPPANRNNPLNDQLDAIPGIR